MKNKLVKIVLFCTLIFIISGCAAKEKGSIKTNKINLNNYNTKDFNYITCSTSATGDNIDKITIKYEVYYDTDKYVQVLKAYEKIKSTNQEIIKTYKKAYQNTFEVYDNLKYYDYSISTTKTSVTRISYINYGKIDMDKLMKIEGTKDNVTVTNGKIKLSDWKSFAKKYGTTCQDSE